MEDKIVQPLECAEGDGLLSDGEVQYHMRYKAKLNLPPRHKRCDEKLFAQKQLEIDRKWSKK